MSAIGLKPIGRFGNQLFQYAYARALAEQSGRELHVNPWIGTDIFELPDKPLDGSEELLPENYRQTQADLIYSRADCRRWFEFNLGSRGTLKMFNGKYTAVHLRAGDYLSCGYPVVSQLAAESAMREFGYDPKEAVLFCSDKNGHKMQFDFLLMAAATTLFRSNSTFSWWASVLGTAKTYAPVITGLGAGEHDVVPFVEGNWPRFVELEFVTDLHLRES